jgi:hypothetical protein
MWKDHFDRLPTTDASRMRGEIAGARVDSNDAFAKIANGVAAFGVPINYSIDGHVGVYTLKMNEHRWDGRFDRMHPDSYWNAALFECAKAFYLRHPFSCPMAGWCEARKPRCLSGQSFPQEVPRTSDCAINEFFRFEIAATKGKESLNAANNDER